MTIFTALIFEFYFYLLFFILEKFRKSEIYFTIQSPLSFNGISFSILPLKCFCIYKILAIFVMIHGFFYFFYKMYYFRKIFSKIKKQNLTKNLRLLYVQ